MRSGTRRNVDRGLLTVGAALIGGCSIWGGSIADSERIASYWASATVDGNGTAQVVEVIDYDFGGNERRGIFRDVPGLDPNAPITVESPTAPDQWVIDTVDINTGDPIPAGETRIRIGDPNITNTGHHRYTIGYPIGVGFEGGVVSWNAVGERWEVGMDTVEAHLLVGNELTDLQCSTGFFGTVGGCDVEQVEPGHLVVRLEDGVSSNEGVTVTATRGAALAAIPTATPPGPIVVEQTGLGLLPLGGAAALFGIVASGIGSTFLRRAGKERVWAGGVADAAFGATGFEQQYETRLVDHAELEEMASIEFAPPKGLAAWQGGVVHAETINRDHQVAWLLDRAIAGEIGLSGEGKDLAIHRAPVQTPEGTLLDGLFAGRQTVELSKYDPAFTQGWQALSRYMDEWRKFTPYWDAQAGRRRIGAVIVGIVALVIGFPLLGILSAIAASTGPAALVGVAVGAAMVGIGIALLVRSWELRVRTPEGSGLFILVESFRRFIDQSDAQHVEAAAAQGRLLEYTAWAAALGEVDRWADAVKLANVQHSAGPQALYLSTMAPGLAAAASTASTQPSSSSGGGGGGVGGGGGGGGGGSW